MAFEPITEEQRQCIVEDLNYDEDSMNRKIAQMKDWLEKESHMPNIPEHFVDNILFSYICGTKMNTEKAKYKLDTSYAIRHILPEIFCHRDPTLQSVRDSVDMIVSIPVSQLTPDGIRVNIMAFNFERGKKFTTEDIKGYYKRVVAITLVRMIVEREFCRGEYIVIDSKGFFLSHLTDLSWPLILKIISNGQNAMPLLIKGVFVINAPGYVNTALNLLKPAIKEKIRKRIHIFEGDHTNLYKFMPRKILPSDYGGDAPSIKESNWAWQKTIESQRDLVLEDEKLITDESKRSFDSISKFGQMFGINGTFTRLNID